MSADDMRPMTVPQLRQMKVDGRRIVALTAYDASFARAVEQAGIDVILVGDSLGMVVQGHKTTLPVTLDDMVYHTACVARGVTRALLVADLPFLASQGSPESALHAAGALVRAGAQMVKLEGAGPAVAITAYLCARGIPVCAHIGLTPQFVNNMGGFRVQGRGSQAMDLKAQAQELALAGASAIVLEGMPAALAGEITLKMAVPTIGIGAGGDCDGQVLVMHDVLGLGSAPPRFVRDFLRTGGSIEGAFRAYATAVRERTFPAPAESYLS